MAKNSLKMSLETDFMLPSCLEASRITTMPSSAYYVADFVSAEEEETILSKVRCFQSVPETTLSVKQC